MRKNSNISKMRERFQIQKPKKGGTVKKFKHSKNAGKMQIFEKHGKVKKFKYI